MGHFVRNECVEHAPAFVMVGRMDEMQSLKKLLNPSEILFVADAMLVDAHQ